MWGTADAHWVLCSGVEGDPIQLLKICESSQTSDVPEKEIKLPLLGYALGI